jgi:hypothetical protein
MDKLNQSSSPEIQENFEDYDPRDDQILELSTAISELANENKLLRDGIMARINPNPVDGSITIGQVVGALEKEIHFLKENTRVLTISRNGYMNDVSERQRAALYWKKRSQKAEKQLAEVLKNA